MFADFPSSAPNGDRLRPGWEMITSSSGENTAEDSETPTVQVIVKHGKDTFQMKALPDTTMQDIKLWLEKETQVEVCMQKLVFRGKKLNDEVSIKAASGGAIPKKFALMLIGSQALETVLKNMAPIQDMSCITYSPEGERQVMVELVTVVPHGTFDDGTPSCGHYKPGYGTCALKAVRGPYCEYHFCRVCGRDKKHGMEFCGPRTCVHHPYFPPLCHVAGCGKLGRALGCNLCEVHDLQTVEPTEMETAKTVSTSSATAAGDGQYECEDEQSCFEDRLSLRHKLLRSRLLTGHLPLALSCPEISECLLNSPRSARIPMTPPAPSTPCSPKPSPTVARCLLPFPPPPSSSPMPSPNVSRCLPFPPPPQDESSSSSSLSPQSSSLIALSSPGSTCLATTHASQTA